MINDVVTVWYLLFSFRLFCTIERPSLFSFVNRICIVFSSDDMISHSWKILYSSSSYQHNTVFLKCMRFTRNICQNFSSIRKSYFCKFSLCWIWFLRTHYRYLQTYASFEWCRFVDSLVIVEFIDAKLQSRSFGLIHLLSSSFFDQLVDSWHNNNIIKF